MVKTIDQSPIKGQHRAWKLIKYRIENDIIPTAFLFHGPTGTGKYQLAKYLAEKITGKRWGIDINNIISIYPTDTSSVSLMELQDKDPTPLSEIKNPIIPISVIKELRSKLSLAVEGKRCVVIKNIEYARTEAINAFLKTLEEPPEDTHFIITTDNLNSVIETIRSRCILIPFSSLSPENISEIIQERGEENDIDMWAYEMSGGSFIKYTEWTNEGKDIYEKIKSIFMANKLTTRSKLLSQQIDEIKEMNIKNLFHLLLHMGKESYKNYLSGKIGLDENEIEDWISMIHRGYTDAKNNISLEIILYNIIIETEKWRFF